jgi:hypothetical protein
MSGANASPIGRSQQENGRSQVTVRLWLTTPSAPSKVASHHFIDGAATPPFQGGEFPLLTILFTAPMTADNPATCNMAGGHLWRLRAIALALRGPPLQSLMSTYFSSCFSCNSSDAKIAQRILIWTVSNV